MEFQAGLRPLSVLVASTSDGRIFLCGQDAAVHEFEITPDAWWGQGKCRKRKYQVRAWCWPRGTTQHLEVG